MPGSAQLKYIVLSVLFLVASVNFTKTTIDIIKSSKRLDDLQSDVSSLEQEKTALEDSVAYKKTGDYVEEKARNELNLAKPGETVYVVVDEDGGTTPEPGQKRVLSATSAAEKSANWYQWYKLFF